MAFGFTERQARFLVHVLVHAGVFIERQYCSFARIAHGQNTHDFLAKLHPMGRVGAITDIADAVLFLESAPFITGEVIHVDGGWHAGQD